MRYEMKSGKEYVSKVQASVWCRLVYGMPLPGVVIYKFTKEQRVHFGVVKNNHF